MAIIKTGLSRLGKMLTRLGTSLISFPITNATLRKTQSVNPKAAFSFQVLLISFNSRITAGGFAAS
jgi:hypothetical protein